MKNFGITAFLTLCLLTLSSMANATVLGAFRCNLGQSFAFIEVTEIGQAIFTDSVGPTILTANGRGGFSNDQAAISFNGRNPIINLGGVEYRCEVATGAPPPMPDNAGSGNGLKSKLYNLVNVQGQSLGGKLRAGPGVNHRQVGSLVEGTFITIVSNSGVRFDGYDWFEVDAGNGRQGFQWGGIMCSNGQQIAGVFDQCRNRRVEQPQQTSSLRVLGLSLGGKLRGGPGINHAQVGSLPEGTRITILSNTGVRFDGYDWFEVAAGNGQRGFQWGGIMCSVGRAIAGIYQQCGVHPAPAPTQSGLVSSPVIAPAAVPAQNFDDGRYYRLTTMWQGEGRSLDVVNDGRNNKLILADTGNYSGQYWKFTRVEDGYYRLSTKWQGEGQPIDVVNDGVNNKLTLKTRGNYTGQHWRVVRLSNGYYRLTNRWRGEGKSLDIVNDGANNKPILADTGDYSGQYWRITGQ